MFSGPMLMCLSKCQTLGFHGFSNGFLAGFRDFNPKSDVNRRETVMSLTLTPFAKKGGCTSLSIQLGIELLSFSLNDYLSQSFSLVCHFSYVTATPPQYPIDYCFVNCCFADIIFCTNFAF